MGKTSKPVHFLVHPDLQEWTELQSLESQGHTVSILTDLLKGDLVLGPNCWQMNDDLKLYLPLALAEARRLKGERGG